LAIKVDEYTVVTNVSAGTSILFTTLLRWLLRRRLCSTARMCRSIEVRQEVVGTCGLSSQLPRRLDFFAEK